jgi:peptidoglycan/LPS O-acetylase OafA/YrhL
MISGFVIGLLYHIMNTGTLIFRFLFPFSSETENTRVDEIDGLRGWAAARVVIYHTIGALNMNHLVSPLMHRIFLDGPMCVRIFFILSGDALSFTALRTGSKGISPGIVLKRIPRLSGTITIGVLLMYVFNSLGWVCSSLNKTNNEGWPSAWLCNGPLENLGIIDYISLAWFGVYYKGSNPIDDFLWTMPVELKGSCIVFCLCSALPRLKDREWIIAFVFLFFVKCFDPYDAFFVFGVLLGQLRVKGLFSWLHRNVFARIIAGLIVLMLPFPLAYPDYFKWIFEVNIPGVGNFKDD